MKTILRSVGQFVHQLDGPISGDSILTINSDLFEYSPLTAVIYGKSQVLCFPHNIVKLTFLDKLFSNVEQLHMTIFTIFTILFD